MHASVAKHISKENENTLNKVLCQAYRLIENTAKDGYTSCRVYQWPGVPDEAINGVMTALIGLDYNVEFIPKGLEVTVPNLKVSWETI